LELSRLSEFCPLVPFLFILMQYCNGGSLDELIWHDGNPLRPKAALHVVQVWRFLLDILQGLQHLHRQGILHRDLKPTNILLQRLEDSAAGKNAIDTPRAMLSDFGTAAPFGEPLAGVTSRGYTGTVEYTAPELLNGQAVDREYTEKSDMWSLGIVLYALCFSALPFQSEDPHALKGVINRFVEKQRSGSRVTQGAPLLTGGDGAEAAAAWLPPDSSSTQVRARGGRLGSLRLVVAALLAIDPTRRPIATDLLENAIFRGQAMRNVHRSLDYAALTDKSVGSEVVDLT
jgi:serine/threonine protein kinase